MYAVIYENPDGKLCAEPFNTASEASYFADKLTYFDDGFVVETVPAVPATIETLARMIERSRRELWNEFGYELSDADISDLRDCRTHAKARDVLEEVRERAGEEHTAYASEARVMRSDYYASVL